MVVAEFRPHVIKNILGICVLRPEPHSSEELREETVRPPGGRSPSLEVCADVETRVIVFVIPRNGDVYFETNLKTVGLWVHFFPVSSL